MRCITAWCIAVYCNAMYGAAAWRGTAGALGFVRCSVDGTGSARQAFASASAFNQNIGSWNTSSVSNMDSVCALVPSHACGAYPASSGPGAKWSRRRCGDGPPRMWASPGADVGQAWLNCERALCILSMNGSLLQRRCAMQHRLLHRCILQRDVWRCGVEWSGVARLVGSALCAALWGDGVGSALQVFHSASAFNQNIGSWSTARVTTMATVSAFVLSHACGAQPKSSSQQWSRKQVVSAQMWGLPTSDVGESRRRCGRVLEQMWVRLGSTVNKSSVSMNGSLLQ